MRGRRRDEFNRLDPANVSPFVAYLATEDCPIQGRVFYVAGGDVALFKPFSIVDRIRKDDRWTIEELQKEAAHFADVELDLGRALSSQHVGADHLAAVDHEGVAGDPRRRVAREEHRGAGDVFRLHELASDRVAERLPERTGEVGLHQPGRDAVHRARPAPSSTARTLVRWMIAGLGHVVDADARRSRRARRPTRC